MLNERSDVYSFGILLMEIISGRTPVDYSRPPGEVCVFETTSTTNITFPPPFPQFLYYFFSWLILMCVAFR